MSPKAFFILEKADMGTIDPKAAAYEAAKRAWKQANPDVTPEQYERAMRSIAKKYGV